MPYYSDKRLMDPFNGKFAMPEVQGHLDPNDDMGIICCRHLASWYLDAARAAATPSDKCSR